MKHTCGETHYLACKCREEYVTRLEEECKYLRKHLEEVEYVLNHSLPVQSGSPLHHCISKYLQSKKPSTEDVVTNETGLIGDDQC